MNLKFNINRPKISDEEIKQHQDFDALVKQFKRQSLKKAQGDESWRKNKKIRYSTVIAGITVVCTITYLALTKNQSRQTNSLNETLTTHKTETKAPAPAKAFIAEPSKTLKIGYSSYKVNNSNGGTIKHSTDSKIKIPKSSFVNKKGEDIVGDVTIEYREFHDHADVIASGIPMAYDSAGTAYNLETAGMFDIRGTQNGEPVFIKENKPLEVELASQSNEQRFNQYYLDTIKRNWQYIKKDQAQALGTTHDFHPAAADNKATEALLAKNPKLSALKNHIDVVIPKRIDSVKVAYASDAKKLPTPKEPAKPVKASGRPTFKLDASPTEFPELQAFKNAVFEVGPENKNYSKEFTDVTWSSISVSQGPVKGKNYLLTLRYRTRVEELVVYPVLNGVDYEYAKSAYQQNLDNYQALVEKRQAKEERLLKEMEAKEAAYIAEQKKKQEDYNAERAKLMAKYNVAEQNELTSSFNALNNQNRAMRIFSVSKFGIYNSDCPHSLPAGAITVTPKFMLNGRSKSLNPDLIYLVDHTARTVYSLDKERDGSYKLKYDPARDYSICVFVNQKLFLCNKALFKQSSENESHTFSVTALPGEANTIIDVKKALEI